MAISVATALPKRAAAAMYLQQRHDCSNRPCQAQNTGTVTSQEVIGAEVVVSAK